ncbi:sporulation integral membrane protein YtvI [Paenibacillus hemerocallicola]|uniref:Sporulation integral membrane protein YtvI n=1 Tax=Paenibacillus hemerocallicola TaxID=1172614 RepID=A0A5C4TDV6_9BACL|nr:sporulation integral membrane protein YtvI [Paenibacillus hemerocallicola]TNJ66680.1 sporulation integral membrane protein YtvI [Paenibacillus hemerocallicola]
MSMKTIVLIVLGIGFLYGLFTIGMPFLMAIAIAMFLETPIVAMMRVFRLNRIVSATIVCTLFTLLLFGAVYLIGAGVVSQLVEIWKKTPTFLEEFDRYFRDATERTQLFYNSLPADAAKQLQTGLEHGVSTLTNSISGIIGGISSYFLNAAKAVPNLFVAFVVFMVALYLMSYSLPVLKNQFTGLFEEKSRGKVEDVLGNLRSSVIGFLRAQIILSALTYIVSLTGLLILRVEYPLAVALLIVIVDVLPILGTGSVIVPWAAFVLIKGEMGLAIGLLILFVVITIFRRIVEPKILGDSIGIGALPTLVGLYVGFKLMGVVGLFLGPIVIMIYKEMRKVGLLQFKIKLE